MSGGVVTLGGRMLGEGQPCLMVAHVAEAHGGSPDRALRTLPNMPGRTRLAVFGSSTRTFPVRATGSTVG